MTVIGYELKSSACSEYFKDEKTINFELPRKEIEVAQELGKSLQEIESLIPDHNCPECASVNKIECLHRLYF